MAKKEAEKIKGGFVLPPENYKLIAAGFVIIVIGFLLMLGGKSESPNEFSEKIFSFRRVTLAPVIVISGFIFEIWAIMRKPRKRGNNI
ncbi:MAG: DUF3098 domain-containing protein [Bacteroidales bacterium]